MATSSLYDDIIMDHIRNARNYRLMERTTRSAEANNPLCGDALKVYVDLDGDRVADVSFQCECCGISMASASMMTEAVLGRTRAEVAAIRDEFRRAVETGAIVASETGHPDHHAMLQFLRATPARKNCALLSWTALSKALSGG